MASVPVTVDEIPVAHTPVGGWSDTMPEPVLARCNDPIVDGAPDLRGMWRVIEVYTGGLGGAVDPEHRALGRTQRIEQAGNRVVITASGIIHDMRADGTIENGVHDVAEMDKTTKISVVATFEGGVHVLRPVGLPIEVTRWRDGEHLMWGYVGFTARLQKIL